jgi:hypothetical protein
MKNFNPIGCGDRKYFMLYRGVNVWCTTVFASIPLQTDVVVHITRKPQSNLIS